MPGSDKTRRYPFNHLKAVRHLKRCDAHFERLIGRVGRFRMEMDTHASPYDALIEAIIYQQLHGKAAATILKRLKDQIGGGDFPTPEQILAATDARLRAPGLSRQKMAAIRDLAQKTIEGVVPNMAEVERLTDEKIIERLTAVRGVGVWTVHMLLIFRLGRPDVLPTLDYAVQQGFKLAYGKRKLPKPKQLLAFGESWRPYRSVASWYLWQAVHLHRSKKLNLKAR
ncbi:MAG: DNA-3-methyladenine glycosylase [Candidatus Acidiferrales bacterium]